MTDEKIDFSALDPAQDPSRWERLIESVAQRALAGRARPNRLLLQLSTWARPALALAAGLAIAIWCAVLATGGRGTTTTETHTDPVVALATWAMNDAIPTTVDPVVVLGGSNGSK